MLCQIVRKIKEVKNGFITEFFYRGGSEKVLWRNPDNVLAAFDAQSVTLNDDIRNYALIKIVFLQSNDTANYTGALYDNPNASSFTLDIAIAECVVRPISVIINVLNEIRRNHGTVERGRKFKFTSYNSVTFNNGFQGADQLYSFLYIPVAIIGMIHI